MSRRWQGVGERNRDPIENTDQHDCSLERAFSPSSKWQLAGLSDLPSLSSHRSVFHFVSSISLIVHLSFSLPPFSVSSVYPLQLHYSVLFYNRVSHSHPPTLCLLLLSLVHFTSTPVPPPPAASCRPSSANADRLITVWFENARQSDEMNDSLNLPRLPQRRLSECWEQKKTPGRKTGTGPMYTAA